MSEPAARQCLRELGQSTHVYALARGINRAIKRLKDQETLARDGTMTDVRRDVTDRQADLNRYIDTCQDGQVGRFPPRELLAALAVSDIVKLLEPYAVSRREGIDMRNFSLEAVRRYGRNAEVSVLHSFGWYQCSV